MTRRSIVIPIALSAAAAAVALRRPSPTAAAALPTTATAPPWDDDLWRVRQNQVDVLRRGVDLAVQLYSRGLSPSTDDVNRLSQQLVEARLRLAATPEERAAVLRDGLVAARAEEQLTQSRFKAGLCSDLDVAEAEVARLRIEEQELLEARPPSAAPSAPPSAPPSPDPFPFAVPFESGASKFDPGDRVTVTDVHGTTADLAGGIYRISGTYTLASHDTATLAASVTARDAADGKGPWNTAQQVRIAKGTGTFTLLLPVSIRGWPHVSFYDGGSDFGGIYVGTGDAVLRK